MTCPGHWASLGRPLAFARGQPGATSSDYCSNPPVTLGSDADRRRHLLFGGSWACSRSGATGCAPEPPFARSTGPLALVAEVVDLMAVVEVVVAGRRSSLQRKVEKFG